MGICHASDARSEAEKEGLVLEDKGKTTPCPRTLTMVPSQGAERAPPVTVAVAGAAGLIGRRHVAHVVSEQETRLHSVVDPTPGGEALAREQGVPHHADLGSLLSGPLPTAVILATPSLLHISQALQLVPRGIHVLIEKPLCGSCDEAAPLVAASKAPGAGTILVGFHRRFNPYVARLRAILGGQSSLGASPIGTPLALSALWCTRKPASYFLDAPWRQSVETGGGVILTNLSHELDLFSSLLGPIERVFAECGSRTRGYNVEETVAITLRFASGCVGTCILSDAALTPHSFESATGENPLLSVQNQPVYTLMGTRGTINFPTLDYWSHASAGQADDGGGDGDWTRALMRSNAESLPFDDVYATDVGPMAPFTARLKHWVSAIRGLEPIGCTLDDGLRNVELLEAVVRSAREGVAVTVTTQW